MDRASTSRCIAESTVSTLNGFTQSNRFIMLPYNMIAMQFLTKTFEHHDVHTQWFHTGPCVYVKD